MPNRDKNNACRKRMTASQLFTIPNILSYIRIALIPLIVWLYIGKDDPHAVFIVILISSLTDILDGFIARRFNMITDFGKMIDPVADKLTQVAIIICLVSRFPLMLLPLCIMPIKEGISFIIRLRLFRAADVVIGACWHGKANTVVLYTVICAHVLFPNFMQGALSAVTILISVGFMISSFVLYTVSGLKLLSAAKAQKQASKLR